MCLAGRFAVDDQGNREPAGDSLRPDARQESPLFTVITGEQHLDESEAQAARGRAILFVEENRNRLFAPNQSRRHVPVEITPQAMTRRTFTFFCIPTRLVKIRDRSGDIPKK
jgi:hypothetical protein